MVNQLIYWVFFLGFQVGIAVAIHAMSSYCIFALHTTLHKLDALQKLNRRQRMQGLLACELLTPALQEAFEDISPTTSLTERYSTQVSPLSITLSPACSMPPDNDIESGGQLPEASISIAGNSEALHAGQRVREQLESIPPLISREGSSALLTRVAERIRQPSYSLKDFHADMVRCFPELQLYLGGCLPAADTVEASAAILKNKGACLAAAIKGGGNREARTSTFSTSGRTGHVEYCRTFGALFCVYWLMRLKLDAEEDSEGLNGQCGFCLGVDENTWESKPQEEEPTGSGSVAAPATEESKRLAFLHSHDWSQMQQLMIDAGMLVRTKSGGVAVCVERTRAMLVLTAIHDIMKTECLLPTVLPVHAPFDGYHAGEMIYDHDAALGYVLTHDADALPSYADLPPAQRAPVRFTQAELSFNHGWLVQAEAPPGMLLSKFKELLESGGMSAADVAFYFVHWLTDLAGAEGAPLAGAEKFVVKFPHVVLNSFIRSFPIVQQLATLTETELMERFLVEWWPDSLGPLPIGPEAVALMRLVVQVQSPAAQPKVVEAFHALSDDDRATLATEMAITGIDGQTYTASPSKGGPAFLVYYSPAFLRQSVSNALAGLRVLAGVYRAARELFPLSADHGGCVIVHIDQLKAEGDIESLCATAGIGNLWMLVRKGEREAVAERYALFDNVSLTPPDEPHQVLRIGKSLLATAVTSIR
mmetsp:Transcript_22047/g.52227  ORF Transcript_22047/g.52227 Transcript_22047/m.52227 type:complete len:706 (-) Transcript_22047:132-2249(-)